MDRRSSPAYAAPDTRDVLRAQMRANLDTIRELLHERAPRRLQPWPNPCERPFTWSLAEAGRFLPAVRR